MQDAPLGQTVPQTPQLNVLELVSTQPPLQSVRLPHPAEHIPVRHTLGEVQVVPHFPQLEGSEAVSTQLVPQGVRPDEQTHFPALQRAPLGQAVVHDPQ